MPESGIFDFIAAGRSGIDLYAEQVGVPFEEVRSFAAYVGGSPANTVIGVQRLGLRTALLTAVGDDPVGDFILHFLNREGVETAFVPRKKGANSAATIMAMQPPDRFPMVMYREGCADWQLDVEDVRNAPLERCRLFHFAGTNLSREPSRSATLYAAERARSGGATISLDLDLRLTMWPDPQAYGSAMRLALPLVDIAIGTGDEIRAAAAGPETRGNVDSTRLSEAQIAGDTTPAVALLLGLGPTAVIEKRGAAGSRVHQIGVSPIDAEGFSVEIQNTLGAGDAFAAGFLYSHLKGSDWFTSARFGNACGAILVTRHGCSAFSPTLEEVESFITSNNLPGQSYRDR